jgi:DNA-binding LacI/PurR family transcriptional regulator
MTMDRVAKLAGVSSSTVSRVINNRPRVAPETAESVRKAMQTLGYTPSDRRPGPKPASRQQSKVCHLVFLVLGTSGTGATPAFEHLLRGVSGAAAHDQVHLTFSHLPDPEEAPSRIIEQHADGILLHGAAPGALARERLSRIPAVWLMGNRTRPAWGDQVLPDGFGIGELAAKYLMDRGHRHLAFFNLDQNHWSLRMYGYSFAAAATATDPNVTVSRIELPRQVTSNYWRDYTIESVGQIVQRYLALPERPTGIFVAEDRQVAMIQPALQKHGVEIAPGKVEIVSCNNEQPYLVGLMPKPAVIDIRTESIGRRGVEQLLWRLEHKEVPERIITTIEPTIIVPDAAAPAHPSR